MKKALTYLTLIYLLFLLFLAFSGFSGGAMGNIIYYLAFLIPAVVAVILKKGLDTAPEFLSLKLRGANAVLLAPLIAPTLLLVFFISWLVSLLLSFIGGANVTDVSGNIVKVILTHAVLTSVCEELLFRYIPLAFLSPLTKRGAVLISALFFAFAHCNLYQIPYAFAAGIIFAAIDLTFGSIWPSVLIHFANNLLSIFWLRNADNPGFTTVYIVLLLCFAVISLAVLIVRRVRYKEILSDTFGEKCKYELSYEPLIFFAVSLAVAMLNLWL